MEPGANEAKKRECEREGARVDALRACIRAYKCAFTCARVRVPHCGLEEVERIRENRVSFRSASARGLGPFVLSSRNPEEEDNDEGDEEGERRISLAYAPEEREENHRGGTGLHVEIVLPCPATTCDPAVNPPSFQDPFLPSFLPDVLLPPSITIPSFFSFTISLLFDFFHLVPSSSKRESFKSSFPVFFTTENRH